MDVSGEPIDVSGGVVDVSGEPIDVSGGVVDVSGEPIDVSGGVVDVSGESIDVSGGVIGYDMLPLPEVVPTPPPQITLADILAATDLILQKESQDRTALESIGSISFETLRTTLIQWAKAGFPNAYTIYVVAVSPPETCSDGEKRGLAGYISFLTGKTLAELIAPLQARCPDFVLSYATTGPEILVVVSRASPP